MGLLQGTWRASSPPSPRVCLESEEPDGRCHPLCGRGYARRPLHGASFRRMGGPGDRRDARLPRRQGLDEYVVSSGLAQEDVAIETMTGGMVALAHLIHQQRTPPLLPTTSRASNPMVGIRRAALGGSILRRLRQARVGRALRLLRNVEARLAWLRRGEAQVQQELAGCLDPDRQTDLKRRLDLVRDEITRTEGLLR